MKKTVILILAILPIVLLVVIAFAGRILEELSYISVERVEFIDHLGTPYGETEFTIEQGTTDSSFIKVYPERATNKRVTYISKDPDICSVDENGVLTAVHWGSTDIIVKTDDSAKTSILRVKVTADVPAAVFLPVEELSMVVDEVYNGFADDDAVFVDAPVAVNKNVTYSTSDESIVKVDSVTGKLTAMSAGEAIITVTTVKGNRTDTCKVTVVEGKLPVYFDFDGLDIKKNSSGIYISSLTEINLQELLTVTDGIDKNRLVIGISSQVPNGIAELVDGVLTLKGSGIVTIKVYSVDDEGNSKSVHEMKIGLKSN